MHSSGLFGLLDYLLSRLKQGQETQFVKNRVPMIHHNLKSNSTELNFRSCHRWMVSSGARMPRSRRVRGARHL